MVRMTAAVDFEGRPLSVLSDLIEKRKRYLGETTSQAVVATGMNVLSALRAATRIAPARIPRRDVRFGESEPRYIHGTRGAAAGKLMRRVIVHRYRDGKMKNLVRWQQVEGESANRRAQAKDLAAAWRRFGAISNRGLAKHALGVALRSLGSRTAESAAANPRMTRLAAANIQVRKFKDPGGLSIEIHDALKYAKLALKGGAGAFDLALMRAANRTAGRLREIAARKFGEEVATPFPEVAGVVTV